MDFMTCNACRRVVQINATGICLGCQKGFKQAPDQDSFDVDRQKEIERLEARQKEIENALKEESNQKVQTLRTPSEIKHRRNKK